MLGLLADRGLLQGQTLGIDATTLEANAALRSIVRRDTGESYEEFLRGLAKASGIETPTREDLVRLDRKRKKRTSNKEWKSPGDEDARIAKMKDGSTHLAHKAEHAVDMDTGAAVAVMAVTDLIRREAELRPHAAPRVNVAGMEELVTDKGYHSGAVVERVRGYGVTSYIPEKKQTGQRNWAGQRAEQRAVIGTVEDFTSKAAARKGCEGIRATLNKETRTPRTMTELIAHYTEIELCEESGKAHSTREVYRSYYWP